MLAWFAAATAVTAVILGGALCVALFARSSWAAAEAAVALAAPPCRPGVPGRDPAWAAVEQPCGAVAVAARDP